MQKMSDCEEIIVVVWHSPGIKGAARLRETFDEPHER